MTEPSPSNALKLGAFNEILILPGEDPAAFDELKRSLFAEYNVSGCSEESTMTSIAKAMWQLQRLGVYEHVQYLRARGDSPQSFANGKSPITEAINECAKRVSPFRTIHRRMFQLFRFSRRKKATMNFCSNLAISSR
jgi:hypothetical protein